MWAIARRLRLGRISAHTSSWADIYHSRGRGAYRLLDSLRAASGVVPQFGVVSLLLAREVVAISSNCWPLSASATRSRTASLLIRKRAEVPGVTFSRTSPMKLSSMPISEKAPESAPVAAPMAAPSKGMKKSRPNSRPQNAPPSAPIPARLKSCRVCGFFLAAPAWRGSLALSWGWAACLSRRANR